jgi:P-type Cu+ transporter
VADAARAELGELADVERFESHSGLGVEGVVDGRHVLAGRPAGLRATAGFELTAELDAARRSAEAAGRTAIAASADGAPLALLTVADALKPTSREAVAALRELGLRPVLLTGDNEATARAVAAQVGIEQVVAEVLPAQKARVVERLQADGRVVAMVGDGVNDAPALAQADLGLAIGTGTDIAIEASELTLVSGDLRAAADAIRLARRTLRTIKVNLFWAFAYNVAALPLAALGLLNPIIAGAAMALSSLFVVSNSLRLRRFEAVHSRRRSGFGPLDAEGAAEQHAGVGEEEPHDRRYRACEGPVIGVVARPEVDEGQEPDRSEQPDRGGQQRTGDNRGAR